MDGASRLHEVESRSRVVRDSGGDDRGVNARELRDLYEKAPCGYQALDSRGTIIRINATELGWLGYRRDELVGRIRFRDLLPWRYHRKFEHNFAHLKAVGGARDSEYELRRRDGSTFAVLLRSLAVQSGDGRFLRTQGSLFDLSERKRAQSELEESELRNTAILQAALDCILSVDSAGRIIEFNPAAERTFGYTRHEALARPVSTMIGSIPMSWSDGTRAERAGSPPGCGRREEASGRRRDGSRFPIELAVTPVRLHEQTIFTVYVRDITRQKEAEEELRRHAESLRAASRRLVQVQEAERRALAGELHDLVGQKLTALSINLNIVKNRLSPHQATIDGARLADSLKLVEETIESIRGVMGELRPAVLDDYGLTPVLRWYAEQFTQRTGIATSVVERGASRRLPAVTEEALYRIAQEALANVAKYSGARKAKISLATMPPRMCLVVSDDGRGFDASVRCSPDRHHGWGLMIMRERAAAVGAQLRVQSAPGRGTRVIVRF